LGALCAVTCGYLVRSVVASQSEPATILAANRAQHIAKPNIGRSDLCHSRNFMEPVFRESVTKIMESTTPADEPIPRMFGIRHMKSAEECAFL
jgi:hypothetical protein